MTNPPAAAIEPYVISLSMDGRTALSFEPRQPSGWAAYFSDETEKCSVKVFLRVGSSADGPTSQNAPNVVYELRVIGCRDLAEYSALTRSILWGRITAAINQEAHRRTLASLVEPLAVGGGPLSSETGTWTSRPDPRPLSKPDLRVEIPDGFRKPDGFYRRVGELFLWLGAVSSRPALDLAEANEVRPTTVHRWIREAKVRGVLIIP